MVIGGFLAFSGKVNLGVALAAAISGAIIGDSVGYEVGKKWGDGLLHSCRRGSSSPSTSRKARN